MMGEIVEFPSNGATTSGYRAAPDRPGPGVLVIQEWWGLVDHIKAVCERFAREGFVALAPDLFHGRTTTEPDEANKLMMQMKIDQAARDMSGAVEHLLRDPLVEPKKVGVTGFCLGGALTLVLAAKEGERIGAAVPFYGLPSDDPGYGNLRAPVLGHFAEHDDWASPAAARKLFDDLVAAGVDAEMHIYPGTHHAFFNDDRPEVHDAGAAKMAWERTVSFFRTHLA